MGIGRRRGAGLLVVLVLVAAVLGLDALRRDDHGGGPAGGGPAGERRLGPVPVLRVVDGDTIEVEIDGEVEDVRYIGVDTPETVKPGTPVECFGKEASAFNRSLVEGRRVRLTFDRERRDRYGRLLAYVRAGGRLVNAELVRGGYARTLEIEPNTAMAERLAGLEREAGEAGRGLWSSC